MSTDKLGSSSNIKCFSSWWSPSQDKLCSEFCQETTLHGPKYLSKPKLHITERIFWLLALLASFTAAVILIIEFLDKFRDSPVVTAFQSRNQDIAVVPFPAITICNKHRFSISFIKKLLNDIKENDLENIEKEKIKGLLYFLRTDCERMGHKAKILNKIERGYDILDTDVMNIIENNSREFACDKFIATCFIKTNFMNCSEVFRPVWVGMGMCCTFNMMPLEMILKNSENISSILKGFWAPEEQKKWSEWNYEKPFVLNSSKNYPWRQKFPGPWSGLQITVDHETDEQYCSYTESDGIYFSLHSPSSLSNFFNSPTKLDFGQDYKVKIDVDAIEAERNLKDVEVEKRGCVFPQEKMLNAFRPYNIKHCHTDYLDIFHVKTCNCTYMLTPLPKEIPLCQTPKQLGCTHELWDSFIEKMSSKFSNCLSLCEDISYPFQLTSADIWSKEKHRSERNETLKVFFYMVPNTITPKIRKQLYGIMDLIANIGSILGLCLGFSVLTAVEVLYQFSIHAFCRRRRGNRRKLGLVQFVKKSKVLQLLKLKGSRKTVTKTTQIKHFTVKQC